MQPHFMRLLRLVKATDGVGSKFIAFAHLGIKRLRGGLEIGRGRGKLACLDGALSSSRAKRATADRLPSFTAAMIGAPFPRT